MPLLDPSGEERAQAAKILGREVEEPEETGGKPVEKPGKDAKAPDEGEQKAKEGPEGDKDKPEAPEKDEKWYEKRIGALTKKLRSQEETMTAREKARDADFRRLSDELTELKQQKSALPALSEDSTPAEVQSYWEKRMEVEREQALRQRLADRLELQAESLRDKYDGADGKPSFDELYQNYASKIDQLPAFVTIKAKIQASPNMPREFYQQAIKLWKAEQKELEDDDTALERDRDAGRSAPTKSSGGGKDHGSKLTDSERDSVNLWFGGKVKPEVIEKHRRAGEPR